MIIDQATAQALLLQLKDKKIDPVRDCLKSLNELGLDNLVTLLLKNGVEDYETSLIPFLLDEKTGFVTSDEDKNNLIEQAMFMAMMVDNASSLIYLFTLLEQKQQAIFAQALFMPTTIQRSLKVVPVLYDYLAPKTQATVLDEALDGEDVDVLRIVLPFFSPSIQKQVVKEHEDLLEKEGEFSEFLTELNQALTAQKGTPFWTSEKTIEKAPLAEKESSSTLSRF